MIYMVLGMLYESFIHPITILSGLPSAVFGALLTLKIFHRELDLYAFVGLIMLFGVVKKNAIMMIDFAIEAQRVEGQPAFDAIVQGCILRFRPIMMTTLAALFGTFPIALGIRFLAPDARQPLGLAVVGGLLFSQFITAGTLHRWSTFIWKHWRGDSEPFVSGATGSRQPLCSTPWLISLVFDFTDEEYAGASESILARSASTGSMAMARRAGR